MGKLVHVCSKADFKQQLAEVENVWEMVGYNENWIAWNVCLQQTDLLSTENYCKYENLAFLYDHVRCNNVHVLNFKSSFSRKCVYQIQLSTCSIFGYNFATKSQIKTNLISY